MTQCFGRGGSCPYLIDKYIPNGTLFPIYSALLLIWVHRALLKRSALWNMVPFGIQPLSHHHATNGFFYPTTLSSKSTATSPGFCPGFDICLY
jgi:hypothetical protein